MINSQVRGIDSICISHPHYVCVRRLTEKLLSQCKQQATSVILSLKKQQLTLLFSHELTCITMPKIITVFGATGGQGGGVVSAMLKAISRGEDYAVRAVTRKPDGAKGQDLKSKGCEVVKCDMDDKASVEEAVRGSYGVYLVTNYWEHFSAEKEIDQGKRVIDVSEALGVKHLIYSGLENVKKAIGLDCGK